MGDIANMVPSIGRPSAPALILTTTRCWRLARDARQPVQPALFALLAQHRCGGLAPAFDSVLRFYEACSGRRIRIGRDGDAVPSPDERRLLALLGGPDDALSARETRTNPGLVPAMRIALRSTRLLLRQRLDALASPLLAGPVALA